MRTLPFPALSSADVLALCLSGTSDPISHARLSAVKATLLATASQYEQNAISERLDLVSRVTSVSHLTKSELTDLYATHVSATRGAARAVYDHIRNLAPNKKCPLCGVGVVKVLDHHLPKSKYPDLSVLPINLVPSCAYCNDTKKARFPKNAGEQTLHPYFDARLIHTPWLSAYVDQGPPVTVVFGPNPPTTWSPVDQARVKRHFLVCGLGLLYGANANDELAAVKKRIDTLARGGSTAVQNYLLVEAAVYSHHANCWQRSMYEALAADTWFCSGGFNQIA